MTYIQFVENFFVFNYLIMSRTDKNSKDMGQLLLSGWAMLGDSCELCNVPLMRNP